MIFRVECTIPHIGTHTHTQNAHFLVPSRKQRDKTYGFQEQKFASMEKNNRISFIGKIRRNDVFCGGGGGGDSGVVIIVCYIFLFMSFESPVQLKSALIMVSSYSFRYCNL